MLLALYLCFIFSRMLFFLCLCLLISLSPQNELYWLEQLTKRILKLIFDELQHAGDIIRFGIVCRFWGLVASEARQQVFKPLRPLSPMLLMPPNIDNDAYKLYDFFKKAYKIQISSWNGWLITINCTYPYEICCLNLISSLQIHLPLVITFANPYTSSNNFWRFSPLISMKHQLRLS